MILIMRYLIVNKKLLSERSWKWSGKQANLTQIYFWAELSEDGPGGRGATALHEERLFEIPDSPRREQQQARSGSSTTATLVNQLVEQHDKR